MFAADPRVLSGRDGQLIAAMASLGSLINEPDLRRMLDELGYGLAHSELQQLLDTLTASQWLRKRFREYRIHAQARVVGIALALKLKLGPALVKTAQWQIHSRKEPFEQLIEAWLTGRSSQKTLASLSSQKALHPVYAALAADPGITFLLQQLPPGWQLELLARFLPSRLLAGIVEESWWSLVESLVNEPQELSPNQLTLQLCLTEKALWEGNTASQQAPAEPALAPLAEAGQAVLAGDLATACQRYPAAFRSWRKQLGLRSGYVPGLSSFWYGLALSRQGDREELGKLLRWASRQQATLEEALFEQQLLLIGSPLDQHSLLPGWISASSAEACSPVRLMELLRFWHHAGGALRAELRTSRVATRLVGKWQQQSGWVARQGADLLARLVGRAPLIRGPAALAEQFLPLTEEQTLTLHPQPAAEAAQQEALQLCWQLVQAGELGTEIAPRIEKQLTTGWSKGQPVTLDQIRRGYEYPDLLTPLDEQILALVDRGASLSDPAASHELTGQLLSLLADHPNLRDEQQHRLILVEQPPVIRVSQDQSHLRLHLEPEISEAHYRLNWHADEVVLVRFPEAWRRMVRILAQFENAIPIKQAPQLHHILSQLPDSVAVISETPLLIDSVTVSKLACRFQVRLVISQGSLRIQLRVVSPQGSSGLRLVPGRGLAQIWSRDRRALWLRNLTVELRLASRLLNRLGAPLSTQPGEPGFEWHLVHPGDMRRTLDTLVQAAAAQKLALIGEDDRPLTLRHLDHRTLQLSITGKGGWLQVDGQTELDETLKLTLAELLSEQRAGEVIPLQGNQLLMLSPQLAQLMDGLSALGEINDQGRLQVASVRALPLFELTEKRQVAADAKWRQLKAQFSQAQAPLAALPETHAHFLRDYQRQGVNWLRQLAHWKLGACLADDMGLGKTLQTLVVLALRGGLGPTLVIAPKSVCANWLLEAGRFTPSLQVRMIQSDELQREQLVEAAGAQDVVVLSYGLLPNLAPILQKLHWATLVLDEAQAIKNPDTQRAKVVHGLKADFRLALTGTPIENHLGELWSLFQFLNPGLLGTRKAFQSRFATPIERQEERAHGQLQRLIAPFVLRRTKEKVLAELPEKTEITRNVELSPEERALYEALRQEALGELEELESDQSEAVRVLAALTRLRRACCHPQLVMPDSPIASSKLQLTETIVDELLENDHRALIFSQFVDHLAKVRQRLDARCIDYCYLDGQTSAKGRQQAIERFQDEAGPPLFLISLKAGGTGLNLTAADYVLHLDPWWNPAVENQATDRAHRMGQTRPVTVYRLVAANTIESRIVELHQEKQALADKLLAGADQPASLSADALKQLIVSTS